MFRGASELRLVFIALTLQAALGSALAPPAGAQAPPSAPPVAAEPRHVPPVTARRATPRAPELDGRLDDPAWRQAVFTSDFLQKDPHEGQAASESTEVAVLFDDDYLYIGARLACPDPERHVRASVSRRDNPGNSERFIVTLDTYHDRRTSYSFGVTATGVRTDYYHPTDGEFSRDHSWDPVWAARSARLPGGWSCEMKIPFSQLRFRNQDVQTWGINFNRWVPADFEDDFLVYIPKNSTGWASRFPELTGLAGIRPRRRLEFLPYLASDAVYDNQAAAGDPFNDGSHYAGRTGGDLKMGLGPNLTLDATFNPDFGQVEADPAQVNLSAFETFYDEKRPFFTEGSQLLQGSGASYYYSRRIGAAPHGPTPGAFVRPGPGGRPDTLGADFAERPGNTTILGAAKVTGRLNGGLSIGALAAVTGRERADLFNAATGARSGGEIEPPTAYTVLRLQQELGANASTVGLCLTGVGRDLPADGPLVDRLNRRAFTGGLDWDWRIDGGTYNLSAHTGFSHITGSAADIAGQQLSSRRYYQRPDVDYVRFDPTRTALSGYNASLDFSKNGGTHWLWEAGFNAESPGLELNDLGRLGGADDIDTWANLRYRENQVGGLLRNYAVGAYLSRGYNFGGEGQYAEGDLTFDTQLKNFTSVSVDLHPWLSSQNDNLTRGGPSMRTGGGLSESISISTNGAENIQGELNGSYSANTRGGWGWSVGGSLQVRTGGRWQFSVSPGYTQSRPVRQYVTTRPRGDGGTGTYGNRYIFSRIRQSQLSAQLRLNYSFTPDLSLEVYAEPFAASGRYSHFGELAAPGSADLRMYGREGTTITPQVDAEGQAGYAVTDGADAFVIARDDFNVVNFNSNVVLRWEWRPGSTFFFVWQQNRAGFEPNGELVGGRRFLDSFSAQGTNYLAAKVTYWIPVN